MADLTPRDEQFVDTFAGFFHDLLRAAGITMLPTKAHERIRDIAKRCATTIEWRAEHKAVEVIRVLQTTLVGSFEQIEGDYKSLEARVKALEAQPHNQPEAPLDGKPGEVLEYARPS